MIRYAVSSLEQTVNETPCTVALGNFDGLHIGHRRLLELAKQGGYPAAVFTFDREANSFLTSVEERTRLVAEVGIDLLFLTPFSLVRDLSCRDFMTFLVDKLACRGVVSGYNFRFGKDAVGDTDTLAALAREHGIACTVLPEVKQDGHTVSSSLIRTLLAEGKAEEASRLLVRPHSITGEVEKGYSVGKLLEAPTMNLTLSPHAAPLCHGVYITETLIDGTIYPSVTNIGSNPTLCREKVTCETNLLNASGDFYGKTVTVRFLSFIRKEKAFSSLEELKKAIANDLATAKAYHERIAKA